MADISQIRLPNGHLYNLKDSRVDDMGSALYCECATAAGTAAKVVTIPDTTVTIEDGLRITVLFTNPNTSTHPTLNVNGTGAYDIIYGLYDDVLGTGTLGTITFGQGQENLLSGACDFIFSNTLYAWVLVSSGATVRNEIVYSATQPTASETLKGTLWVKPSSVTVEDCKVLVITSGALTSLPANISDSNITSDMVVINHEFSNPVAVKGDISWTTNTGEITLAGTLSGSTYITLYLLHTR